MIRARILTEATRNPGIISLDRTKGESDAAWLQRACAKLNDHLPKVLLLGGTSLVDFRVRVAQSHARSDMNPSFWSHAGVLLPRKRRRGFALAHVPLGFSGEISSLPKQNAIEEVDSGLPAGARRYPNLAVLEFPIQDGRAANVAQAVSTLKKSRLSHDFVGPLVRWLGFVCGVSNGNPLLEGTSFPAAAFVEAAFGNANLDLTPSVSERVSCPETIWQAALWWSSFYESDGKERSMPLLRGVCTLGQPAAALVD